MLTCYSGVVGRVVGGIIDEEREMASVGHRLTLIQQLKEGDTL